MRLQARFATHPVFELGSYIGVLLFGLTFAQSVSGPIVAAWLGRPVWAPSRPVAPQRYAPHFLAVVESEQRDRARREAARGIPVRSLERLLCIP